MSGFSISSFLMMWLKSSMFEFGENLSVMLVAKLLLEIYLRSLWPPELPSPVVSTIVEFSPMERRSAAASRLKRLMPTTFVVRHVTCAFFDELQLYPQLPPTSSS